MIWYFLAGFIAGVVGVLMYAHWWMARHTQTVRFTKEEWEHIKQLEEKEHD